ncbi:hypothetical protein [Azospirillum brasilense]|uniref:hypothetical protein n=1 Tax=Azospirillum brasilense TaxID=192 RepID=UPI0013B3E17D|nr:hypothetical protein [Azospirillum brasilense]
MDNNLLIEIYVGFPAGTEQGRIGTGYPIGDGLILTARHLFMSSKAAPEDVSVRWHYQKDNVAGKWQEATILWSGTDELDVAVLSCSFPELLKKRYKPLSKIRHQSIQKWNSQGFADVGAKHDNTREAVNLSGDAYTSADSENVFELGVKYAPSISDGWRGTSGSPVFVGDMIIGVVVTCPENFNQSRLKATPTWKLFQDESFCKLFEDSSEGSQREKALKLITKFLNNFPILYEFVKEQRGISPLSARHMAQDMLDRGLEGFLNVLFILSDQVEDRIEGDQEKKNSFTALCDLVFSTAPLLIDSSVTEPLIYQKRGVFVREPGAIGSRTMGEIAMARIDERKTKFSGADAKIQRGEYELPDPPDNHLESWRKDFESAFDDHLIKEIASDYKNINDIEEARRIVSKSLTSASNKRRTRYYCIESSIMESSRSIESALQSIKAKYPDLILIFLHKDMEIDVIDSIARFVELSGRNSR